MKNRTLIGILCMILAVIITFVISPVVTKLSGEKQEIIRLKTDINQGNIITENDIETVEAQKDEIPKDICLKKDEVINKYAVSNLYSGDYLKEEKLTNESNTADDVFSSLDGTKIAVSFNINTFANGLSGKLQNGDIISIIVVDKEKGTANVSPSLKYVKVITTTTSKGVDKDSVVKNEDGTYELPSTVTVLLNYNQARVLSKYEDKCVIKTALVYRGNKDNADKFLLKQEEYLNGVGDKNE